MNGKPSRSDSRPAQREARLRALGRKAADDPQSLSLQDLDSIVDLVAEIGTFIAVGPEDGLLSTPKLSSLEPFKPLAPHPHPHPEAQLYLRLAYAAEYIAARVYGLARAHYEAAVDARWKAERGSAEIRE